MDNQRRRFLCVIGASAAVMAGCGGDGESEASGTFSAGNVSDLPVGTIRAISGQPLVIARDAAGLYAMSTICTHEQCNMNSGDGTISNTGLVCHCHDSSFDVNGNRTAGPASGTLKHYLVTLASDGAISITAGSGSTVSTETRVAVAAS